jgi:hypothetical protein
VSHCVVSAFECFLCFQVSPIKIALVFLFGCRENVGEEREGKIKI